MDVGSWVAPLAEMHETGIACEAECEVPGRHGYQGPSTIVVAPSAGPGGDSPGGCPVLSPVERVRDLPGGVHHGGQFTQLPGDEPEQVVEGDHADQSPPVTTGRCRASIERMACIAAGTGVSASEGPCCRTSGPSPGARRVRPRLPHFVLQDAGKTLTVEGRRRSRSAPSVPRKRPRRGACRCLGSCQ